MANITLRSSKGSPLTNQEVDNNFSNLNSGKLEVSTWEASDAFGITSTNISNWDTAYGWGDHASAGYLTSHQDISGKANLSGATFTGTITAPNVYVGTPDNQGRFTVNETATSYGFTTEYDYKVVVINEQGSLNQALVLGDTGTMSGSTLLGVSVCSGGNQPTTGAESWAQVLNLTGTGNLTVTGTITASGYNKSNWDTAYGWGDHSTEGYLTSLGWNSNDNFTGTYPIVWKAGDTPYTASWLKVNGTTDTLHSVNFEASGSFTLGTGGNYNTGSIYSDANWGMIFRAKQASPNNAEYRWAKSDDTELMRINNSGHLLLATSQRVFADNYHPNADKWTTARNNNINLTGDVTGYGSASVDGTGNWTVTVNTTVSNNSHTHTNTTLDMHFGRQTQNIDTYDPDSFWGTSKGTGGSGTYPSNYVNIYNFAGNGSSEGTQLATYYGGNNKTWIRTRNDNNNSWLGWTQIFTNEYHPNADKWTTARTHTVTLTGDVSGTASQSVDGTGNKTWTISTQVSGTGHHHDHIQGNGFSNDNLNTVADRANSGELHYDAFSASAANKPPTNDNANGVITVGQHNGNYTAQLAFSSDGKMYHRDNPVGVHGSWQGVFTDAYHPNADKWTTARTLSLTGDVTGSVSWDGSANASITTTVANDSHNHDHSDGRFTVGEELRMSASGNIRSNSEFQFLTISGNAQTMQTGGIGVGASYGTYPAFTGGVNVQNGYQVAGQTVIDSSRNISGVNLNMTGTITTWTNNDNALVLRQGQSGHPWNYIEFRNSANARNWYAGTSTAGNFEIQGETDATGGVNTNKYFNATGGYKVAGTTVIDSNRNLTNIGTASIFRSLEVRSDNQAGYVQSGLYLETLSDYRGAGVFMDNSATNEVWYAGTPYTDHNGYYMIGYASGAGTDAQAQLSYYKLRVDSSGNVSAKNSLQVNGTTVIDSNRNLTNIQDVTISGNGNELNFTGGNNRIKFSGYRAMEGTTDGVNLHLAEQYTHVNCLANMNLSSGHEYRINGTTVIDSSRNLTNIGYIRASNYLMLQDGYKEIALGTFNFGNNDPNNFIDIIFNCSNYWGMVEIEITSAYSWQNACGSLIKRFAVGHNGSYSSYGGGSEELVSDTGYLSNSIRIGSVTRSGSNFIIPINKYTTTNNSFEVRVKLFSLGYSDSTTVSLGSKYSGTNLTREYTPFRNITGKASSTEFDGSITATNKLSISNASFDSHFELVRSGSTTQSLSPSGADLLHIGGNFAPNSSGGQGLGRNDKIWSHVYSNSFQIGTTTVIDSSRNLTNIGTASLSGAITAQGYIDGTTTIIDSSGSLGVKNSSNSTGKGISLYGGAVSGMPTYGIAFAGTATFGNHGGVTSDWATYFTMSNTTTRGWIFKRGSTNVASIDGSGGIVAKTFLGSGSDSTPAGTTFSNTLKGVGTHRTVYFDGDGSNVSTWYGVGNTPFCAIDATNGNMEFWVNHTNGSWYRKGKYNVDGLFLYSNLYFDDYNTRITQGSGNSIRAQTNYGYVDIAPQNSTWCHFQTDRGKFYFNKQITVDSGIIESYDEDLILRRANNNNYKMTLGTSGATFTGNVTAYSDVTLKDNITEIDNALEKVNSIRGVTYDRIDQDNARHAGVIAQEVEEVLPEVVHTDGNGIKSVAYGNMVGLLIEAIKEQQTQIDELKAQINTLKGEK